MRLSRIFTIGFAYLLMNALLAVGATDFLFAQGRAVSASATASFAVTRVVTLPDDGGKSQLQMLRQNGASFSDDPPDFHSNALDEEPGQNSYQQSGNTEKTRVFFRLRNEMAEKGLVSVKDETLRGLQSDTRSAIQEKIFVFVNN